MRRAAATTTFLGQKHVNEHTFFLFKKRKYAHTFALYFYSTFAVAGEIKACPAARAGADNRHSRAIGARRKGKPTLPETSKTAGGQKAR